MLATHHVRVSAYSADTSDSGGVTLTEFGSGQAADDRSVNPAVGLFGCAGRDAMRPCALRADDETCRGCRGARLTGPRRGPGLRPHARWSAGVRCASRRVSRGNFR